MENHSRDKLTVIVEFKTLFLTSSPYLVHDLNDEDGKNSRKSQNGENIHVVTHNLLSLQEKILHDDIAWRG